MKIAVKVTPGATRSRLVAEDSRYKIYLTSSPVQGRANEELVEVLAKHFGVKKFQINIIKGLHSRHKVINIE